MYQLSPSCAETMVSIIKQYHCQRHMFIIQNAAFRHPHSFFPPHHSPAPNLPPSHPPHTIKPHRPKPSQDITPTTESGSNRHLDLDTTTHPTFPEPNRRPRTLIYFLLLLLLIYTENPTRTTLATTTMIKSITYLRSTPLFQILAVQTPRQPLPILIAFLIN